MVGERSVRGYGRLQANAFVGYAGGWIALDFIEAHRNFDVCFADTDIEMGLFFLKKSYPTGFIPKRYWFGFQPPIFTTIFCFCFFPVWLGVTVTRLNLMWSHILSISYPVLPLWYIYAFIFSRGFSLSPRLSEQFALFYLRKLYLQSMYIPEFVLFSLKEIER